MARVEIASMPWGTLLDRHGESQNGTTATLKNLDGSNATTWSAITGGSSSTSSLTADSNGNLPRFVEGGQYTLDVPALGVSGRRVEAVSGSVESRSVLPTDAQPEMYVGNATSSEYTGEANMAIQMIGYFGNAGGHAITGRPQAVRTVAKYFEPTTADSAQANSTQTTMVAAGSAKAQTFPVTGDESDVIVQDNWDASGTSTGHSFAVEAQGTGRVRKARPIYIAAKAAKDAASVSDDWVGIYIEDPATGSAGTITDKAGIHSKPRIQTETGVIIGLAQASLTAAIRGTTLYVNGTNPSGSVAVKILKKSGSTDDILQITDSGAQPQIIVNQNGQFIIKTAGASHSGGSAVGAMIAIGNITTAPSANFTGGTGGFLYVESGALKFRGGSGTVTTIAVT